jgi:3',5'-cyclic AMP phosphodiesterase CpdA
VVEARNLVETWLRARDRSQERSNPERFPSPEIDRIDESAASECPSSEVFESKTRRLTSTPVDDVPLIFARWDISSTDDYFQTTGDYKSEHIPASDRQTRLDAIESTLDELVEWLSRENITLDAVVVTGDVSYMYDPEGFALLGPTLGRLGASLPPPDRVAVVPGNHDVAWGTPAGSAERYAAFCVSVRETFGYRTPLLEGVDLNPSGKLKSNPPVSDPILDLTDSGFVVVAINSANYCGVTELTHPYQDLGTDKVEVALEKLTSVERSVFEKWLAETKTDDVARVSKAQLAALATALRPFRTSDVVVIGALHHHLLPVSTTEEFKAFADITNLGQVREFLSTNCDLVLHGHKHHDLIYTDHVDASGVHGTRSSQMTVVSTSTAGVAEGQAIMRLLQIGGNARRSVGVQDVLAASAGGRVEPRDRGSWFLPNHQRDDAAQTSLELATVRGTTVDSTYQGILGLFDQTRLASGDPSQILGLRCTVLEGPSCSSAPDGYPNAPGRWPTWFDDTVGWWQGTETQADGFTHGQRIRQHAGWFDQIQASGKLLAADFDTSRAVISLLEPTRDLAVSAAAPSFCMVQPRIVDGSLHITGVFRKQEMRYWWPINVAELARIQQDLASIIRARSDRPISLGAITTVSDRAVLSATPPRVVVPMLDQLASNPKGYSRLLDMALAAAGGTVRDTVSTSNDWANAIAQWRPPAVEAADGSPASVDGTMVLADLVRRCEDQAQATRTLSLHLTSLWKLNKAYVALVESTSQAEAFSEWREDVGPLAKKVERLVHARLRPVTP